ncbi:MAG: hypothetical protein R6V19_12975 [Armatimonadota bacterium]
MSEQKRPANTVPIFERVHSGDFYDFMDSEPVQELMAGRADIVEITAAKSYAGQASMLRGLRLVRLSIYHELDHDEMAFIICHELAHHETGLKEQHSDEWRESCADLAREAGELKLLPPKRVKQAVGLALDGTATKFWGWPERAQKRKKEREAALAKLRAKLIEDGVRPGGQIAFKYRGDLVRGEVIRINKTTISVGERGGERTLVRVPFTRVHTIYVE